MDNVISFTPAELAAFIGTIAGVCAGIATITGFIVALVKRWKAYKEGQAIALFLCVVLHFCPICYNDLEV